MKIYGYIRVSTGKQDKYNQEAAIHDFIVQRWLREDQLENVVVFVEETISGKIPWERRKIREILERMEKDEIIVVSELSRLGRTMLEVMEILSIIMKRGVKLYAIKGNYELGDNLQSKVLAFAFSLAGEIERELISLRTKEALALRKKRGKTLGHPRGIPMPRKLEKKRDRLIKYLEKGYSYTQIADLFGVNIKTVTREIKRMRKEKFEGYVNYIISKKSEEEYGY